MCTLAKRRVPLCRHGQRHTGAAVIVCKHANVNLPVADFPTAQANYTLSNLWRMEGSPSSPTYKYWRTTQLRKGGKINSPLFSKRKLVASSICCDHELPQLSTLKTVIVFNTWLRQAYVATMNCHNSHHNEDCDCLRQPQKNPDTTKLFQCNSCANIPGKLPLMQVILFAAAELISSHILL